MYQGNEAGGIYSNNSRVTFGNDSRVAIIFLQNTAQDNGGAIFLTEYSLTYFAKRSKGTASVGLYTVTILKLFVEEQPCLSTMDGAALYLSFDSNKITQL